ncbi:cupin-like domain-containing protein [Xanthomonas hortorum pv. vitians]|uniref:cupin-like domain-containing protein n=1 Tax=Xanthomonas hortorum TaxID=56454 RepID=UPI000BAADDB0|nr:cupin-like domain-containing protein [Xanthomonas hortorum]ASW45530.1 cupin [Xanthomonas hortorum]MCC8494975.1 cupin-like domain-containing protein [Xanthomonas hortorum pv. gardneri]MCE4282118.1 cupin-like domain-containing protein [Xanthomonas hortorum pv. vitians]MCE4285381.1 cupin-like domain-containing protein [Xanthomonas hortorum pv. vitians]MCE4288331.1 cupin-like domain-containing protein [Xanthomonas hortorum pv. vitians]
MAVSASIMSSTAAIAPIAERTDCRPDALPLSALCAAAEPVVVRGIARDWSLVQAGLRSPHEAMAVLRAHDSGHALQYSHGGPEIASRPFYTDDCSALNFDVQRGTLSTLLEAIAAHRDDPQPPTYYLASLPVDNHLPGLRASNDLDFAASGIAVQPSIWIGNRVIASCHYDAPNNLACCAVGQRRFTLFPPEQVANLYPGPLDPTPGGQVVSMVDIADPDLQRYPRFAAALAHARTTVLEPGDALFIPSMWWHHVQSLQPFNVLVNYWWSSAPAQLPAPMPALYHALWAIRDRPASEKDAWRALFDYYVFGPAERAGEHLPEQARHALGPIDPILARQLRAMLIGKLNR